ncbi:MAG TPA: S-methyl-5-thioribose-1-phosphate isomerase [Candidatus Dormibacteraeota bacterium]|jgi:methylthioribose-1-phosphate isomerase|nr:S-methyl-5-thioribose-1-phosphate isomerase [Candidatus Dormibacteraeota bacterium]
MARTVDWDQSGAVLLVDQTLLPDRHAVLRVTDVATLCDCIRRLAVRGAPALGVAGALGMALAAVRGEDLVAAAGALSGARPTAVNLGWGVRRVAARADEGHEAMVAEALRVLDEEVALEAAMAQRGADLVDAMHAAPHRILTHCNTGALAGVVSGSALGVVAELHRRGSVRQVLATETRPLLQGARLTAWELGRLGVAHALIVDGAAASMMARGLVDVVLVGADRIAANGDVANKIGTLAHALAARHAGIPFVVVAPESTVDAATERGDRIPIEERGADEVTGWAGRRVAPPGTDAANPAFDVTPAALITAIVTERRVVRPSLGQPACATRQSPGR